MSLEYGWHPEKSAAITTYQLHQHDVAPPLALRCPQSIRYRSSITNHSAIFDRPDGRFVSAAASRRLILTCER